MYEAVTGCPWTTCARTSNGDRFGNTQYNAVVSPLATGDSMTWLKFLRSVLNRPATKSAKVNAADRIGVENVEKKTAMAVTIASSQNVITNAFNMAGSRAGRSHPAAVDAGA